jgi:pSer/pThr/pTyr-binding forkhead associated (FHA) protein
LLKLHIQDDEGKITVVPVVRDELSIGRKEGMTIRLTERNVSREHAFLKKENGTLYLEDLSARFGTKVNGSKLAGRTELLPGDVIQIGDYLLALHAEEGEDVTDPGDSGEGQGASVSDTGEFGPVPVTTQIIETGEAIASIAKEERARLVVVSRNLGGQESTIAHTPYTVGRTADNDFELAHRSVSSNHGVITYDGGSYTISDMDSANGVKINGDMYRKSDLHPGDEIEMGHVLLRFVGPNENFTFGERHFHTDDLLVADVAPSRMGRIAMIAVLVLAIVAATAWVMHFSKAPSQPSATAVADADLAAEAEQASAPEAVKPEKSAEAEAGTIKEPVVKVEPEPTVEPVVEPEPEPEPTVVKAKDKTPAPQPNEGVNPAKAKALAQQASQAMAAGDYGSAERSARAALKADKRNGRAAGILRKLLNEKRANSALTRAMSAKSTGKWANVLR